MIKDLLEEQQPVVYKALENACREDRISSAYLFTGPKGSPKYDAAVFLAQSILCENKKDSMACETCNTCRRVREGKYADLIVLDGRRDSISKESVDAVQEQFSRTAVEKAGQRVYIIRCAENATVSAQNSMLKFLEEPGRGVTAILTSNNSDRILPTILSRCTVIPFVPMSAEAFRQQAIDAGASKTDACFLAQIVKDRDDMQFFIDPETKETTPLYKHAEGMLKEYLNAEGMHRKELPADYEVSWSSQQKDTSKAKEENLLVLPAFFDLLGMYGRDAIRHDAEGPAWYIEAVKHASQDGAYYAEIIRIAAEEKDLCTRYNDLNLVMYQTFYRLEELDHERGL